MLQSTEYYKLQLDQFVANQNLSGTPKPLYDAVNKVVSSGGKRLRGIWCLMAYNIFQEKIEEALPLSYSLELFHNFTLVHDDIMDEAPMRRGVPSIFASYGPNHAILTGDVMLLLVYEQLNKIKNKSGAIIDHFNTMAIDVCRGQSMDLIFEDQVMITMEEYLLMIELKTAVLLGSSLFLGALLADASEEDQYHLEKFGRYAGIAFQLQDDYLDLYFEDEKFGKQRGGDILQGKKNYFYTRFLNLMDDESKESFAQFYHNTSLNQEKKLNTVLKCYNDNNLKNYCKQAMEGFLKLAKKHLEEVSIESGKKEQLWKVAQHFIYRNV